MIRAGSAPDTRRCSVTRAMKSTRRSCRGDTFTDSCGSSPRADHATCWAHTAPITQSPIDSIRPVSSATGMNSEGGTSDPSSASYQRSSASSATSRPDAVSKIGW